ncbi:FtsX-like permease family protein [Bacteroidales bacterium OttesenSCG-928-K03]|nr:FtsX-like permease family protein [Odoribacter sp. OttesenSCG-928-L07]MDL2238822.1 FtsX-like permease family protein [Bacteroidales bacterium OttesenSCG-928-L14]MDL2240245.1 FtsX-like permease family protein [Bacteroidales bacterium OttesenSCG-928-K22]MDL2242419.1 FtsX-like permease family protein [Bacteroidales bacterium OttesenSCG-928-K03]
MSIKSSLIFWSRNKAYSFICLFGLIVSLVFVIIISNYTKNELSTDNFQTKADRIYVLGNESVYGCAYKLADHLVDRYPEIEKICVTTVQSGIPTVIGENKYTTNITFADTTFFELFDFELVLGDKQTALAAMNSAIISEFFANMVFGNENPMGKALNLNGTEVQVTGVIKDFKNSLFPDNEILIRMEQIGNYNSGMVDPYMSNAGSSVMFILAKEGTNIQSQIPDMLTLFNEIYWPYEMGHWEKVLLTPMRDVYFSDIDINGFNQGNKTLVFILISVSILILIFAIINYINLTVAQSSFRAKEMATRRLLGASRLSVFTKLIIESLIVTFIAYFIALFIASGLDKPAANLLGARDLSVFGNMTLAYFLINILVVFIIGVISGLIPAFIISNFKPIEVVKGSFVHKTKMVFSKVFITIQNIITIALITCSLIMILQVRFMLNAQLGYSTENIIDIDNMVFGMPKAETFKNELLSLANVEDVAFCQGYPLNRGNNFTMKYNDKSISFQAFAGDSAFFKMMEFEIIQDNHIPNWGIWFNETAMKEMELPYDTLRAKLWGEPQNIAGIMKDFQYGSVAEKIGPTMVYYENFKGENDYVWSFLVKVTGDPVQAMNDVKAVYEKVSEGDVFPGEFIDVQIQKMYESEKKTSTILSVFTIMAIIISTLGLYAMSVYFIRQRAGEIATRKIFGSSNKQIISRLLKSFLILVGVAFVIAIPVIWYFMTNWLSDYPLRISLKVWMFLAGGGAALLIAFLTVLYESVKAANANPVESIKR